MKSIQNINLKVLINHKSMSTKKYSLLDDAFSKQDLIEGIKVILSKKITMSQITEHFEKKIRGVYWLQIRCYGKFRIVGKFVSCICCL